MSPNPKSLVYLRLVYTWQALYETVRYYDDSLRQGRNKAFVLPLYGKEQHLNVRFRYPVEVHA